jgi:Fic family protein
LYFNIDDKTAELRREIVAHKKIAREFTEHFELSWIFHENALEGIVLEPYDLKAALEHTSTNNDILGPTYQCIRNQKKAIEKVKKMSANRNYVLTLRGIKNLHVILSYGLSGQQGGIYRKSTPIHRLYFHSIIAPRKISYHINKLVRDMNSKEFNEYHPIQQGVEAHFRLMSIFPFRYDSGKVSRLLMNFFLVRAGYFPVVIPDIERQRYYESLRTGVKNCTS